MTFQRKTKCPICFLTEILSTDHRISFYLWFIQPTWGLLQFGMHSVLPYSNHWPYFRIYNTHIGSLLLNVSILGSSSHLTSSSTFPYGDTLFGRVGELRPRLRGLRGLFNVGLGGHKGFLRKLPLLGILSTSSSKPEDTCIIVAFGFGSRLFVLWNDTSSAGSIVVA